jgi:hypothetical protein
MAFRVVEAEVKAIVEVKDDTPVVNYIQTANMLVEETLASSDYSDDRKKQIELYLSAHFVAISVERGGVVRSKDGEAEEYYGNPTSLGGGLKSTRYGQTALVLDTSGYLIGEGGQNEVSGGRKALFRVL